MIVHNFAFQWKPGVTEEQKLEIEDSIRALPTAIPGVLAIYLGTNFSPRSLGYEFGGSMHFADAATLESYNNHPVHQALLVRLGPLLATVIEVDFESSAPGSV